MKAIGTKTYSATAVQAKSGQRWYLIDAEGQVLGRVASTVAQLLRGKNKPTFTPHMDGGDYVIVVNVEKLVTTGAKDEQKLYRRHSQYPGGLRSVTLRDMRAKHPERVLEAAVRGMLPKSNLGHKIFHHLKVYSGPDHPHEGQQPVKLELARDGHKRGQIVAASAAETIDAAAGTTPANMIERAKPARPRRRVAEASSATAVAAAAAEPVPTEPADATDEAAAVGTASAIDTTATEVVTPATPESTSRVITSEELADDRPAADDKDEQA